MNITSKEELLPFTPQTYHVLIAVAGNFNLTGTDVARHVATDSQGAIILGSGTAYRALDSLIRIGLVATPYPRIFRLTSQGRYWLEMETERLEQAAQTARAALQAYDQFSKQDERLAAGLVAAFE